MSGPPVWCHNAIIMTSRPNKKKFQQTLAKTLQVGLGTDFENYYGQVAMENVRLLCIYWNGFTREEFNIVKIP